MQLVDANKNPEEREELRRHLTENHVEMNTIEKIARYDSEAADVLKTERIRRFNIDKAARQLVVKFISWGLEPEELEELILFGMRCKIAIAQGWPRPPDISPRNYFHHSNNTNKKHNPEEVKNNSIV